MPWCPSKPLSTPGWGLPAGLEVALRFTAERQRPQIVAWKVDIVYPFATETHTSSLTGLGLCMIGVVGRIGPCPKRPLTWLLLRETCQIEPAIPLRRLGAAREK